MKVKKKAGKRGAPSGECGDGILGFIVRFRGVLGAVIVVLSSISLYGCDGKSMETIQTSRHIEEEKWLTADNGNRIYTRWAYPAEGGPKFPAVIVVPGGLGVGTSYIDQPAFNTLLDEGFALVTFNPQGRGDETSGSMKSEGEENYNGHIHQDDLKTVIEAAQSVSYVDPDQIGVVSVSFGISMAAGCLGRHPELKVRFLVDIEGPSDSYVIMADPWLLDSQSENDKTSALYDVFGHYSTEMDPSSENKAWWEEREGLQYVGLVGVPYLRLQSVWDHMQPPNGQYPIGFEHPPSWYQNKHAVDMINSATTGSSPWTRMNMSDLGNMPKQSYSYQKQSQYYDGSFDLESPEFAGTLKRALREMFSLAF